MLRDVDSAKCPKGLRETRGWAPSGRHRTPYGPLRGRFVLVQEDPRVVVVAAVLVEAQHSGDGGVVHLVVEVWTPLARVCEYM